MSSTCLIESADMLLNQSKPECEMVLNHGLSVRLSQRQLDVEQVIHKYTQFLQCEILLPFSKQYYTLYLQIKNSSTK
jgi:hypothetical protein